MRSLLFFGVILSAWKFVVPEISHGSGRRMAVNRRWTSHRRQRSFRAASAAILANAGSPDVKRDATRV